MTNRSARRLSILLSLAVSIAVDVAAQPTPQIVPEPETLTAPGEGNKFIRAKGEVVAGSYIVVFKSTVSEAAVGDVTTELVGKHRGKKRHQYQKSVRGFSGFFHPADAQSLSTDARVAYVEEDGVARGSTVQTLRSTGTWTASTSTAFRSTRSTSMTIPERALASTSSTAASAPRTKSSGAAPSERLPSSTMGGVPRTARITAPPSRVSRPALCLASPRGPSSGPSACWTARTTAPWSVIIAGIDYVAANHVKPAVANLSIGGSSSFAADTAIRNLINAGVLVVGAAGNNSSNACFFTPGSVSEALIVGNSTSL